VGRDTQDLDFAGCRRAAIESVAENFVDGFLGPLFWYVLGGLPGILIFKVVSTMDSMIGYKTAQYLRFGWSGARIDDLLNYVPARIAWFLLGLSACFFPTLSAIKGWRIGMKHHTLLPGPNPGWSEATMAGLLQRRLIGPIYRDGALVTSVWIGDPSDPQGGKDSDLTLAIQISLTAATISVASGLFVMWLCRSRSQ
jgi:adenosylcobinamide-phosphate synthase